MTDTNRAQDDGRQGDDRRQHERDTRALATAWARERWPRLTKNEQGMIRFGLFPADVLAEGEEQIPCDSRTLAIAFMDVASANGGMRA